MALARSANPYFRLSSFASRAPEATCSLCLSWKSVAAVAAARASAAETDGGSLFGASECAGLTVENRDRSSSMCCPPNFRSGTGGAAPREGSGGG
jgi:hypothetical protein